jgi:hypothetical protein
MINVLITEIQDGSNFLYQKIGPDTDKLEQLMNEIHNLDLDKEEEYTPQRKDKLIFAKFSVDGKYYRAKILNSKYVNDVLSMKVFFIDYGNTDFVTVESVRQLEYEKYGYDVLPQLAKTGRLAFVRSPRYNDEFGKEAVDCFKSLVWGKELVAREMFKFGKITSLVLGDPVKKEHINAAMVKAGFAAVDHKEHDDPLYAKLREEEQIVKRDKKECG